LISSYQKGAAMTPPRPAQRAALFVRIPTEQAEALDRVAFELRLPKQDVVADVLARFIDDTRRITVEAADDAGLVVGHHSFRPRENDVLTLEEVAELLQVDADTVAALAGAGELPGRELAGQWRFSRNAVLDWLGKPQRPPRPRRRAQAPAARRRKPASGDR
jgi:excisionase family DNA binding protein